MKSQSFVITSFQITINHYHYDLEPYIFQNYIVFKPAQYAFEFCYACYGVAIIGGKCL